MATALFSLITREMKKLAATATATLLVAWGTAGTAGGAGGGTTVQCEGVHAEHGPGRMIAARVNDDYCDCQGGEDEPGTAACSHLSGSSAGGGSGATPATAGSAAQPGYFFCPNAGARPMNIYHSRVGDGICDCCDGSDEATGPAASTPSACANTCASVGQEWRADQMRARDTLRNGISARREYISRGAEMSTNTATRQEMLREELQALQAKTETLDQRKKEAEEEEKSFRASTQEESRGEVLRRSRILEVIGAAAESSEGVSQFAYDLLMFAKTHKAVGGFRDFLLERLPEDADDRTTLPLPSNAELEAEAAHARDEAARIAAEAATAMEVDAAGAAAVDAAEQLSAQTIDHDDVPTDPAAAAALAARIAAEAASASDPSANQVDAAAATETIQAEAASHVPAPPPVRQTLEQVLGVGENAQSDVTLPKADAARTEYNSHLSLISNKEREIKDAGGDNEVAEYSVEKKYGRDGEFRILKDKCFKKTVQGYAYEMCFFKNAKQDHVRLGSWDDEVWTANGFKIEGDGAETSSVIKAKFTGGQRCWNGPARSLSVEFECYQEDQILDVTEPSVCEYTMKFGTPAVCDPTALEALERELGEL